MSALAYVRRRVTGPVNTVLVGDGVDLLSDNADSSTNAPLCVTFNSKSPRHHHFLRSEDSGQQQKADAPGPSQQPTPVVQDSELQL